MCPGRGATMYCCGKLYVTKCSLSNHKMAFHKTVASKHASNRKAKKSRKSHSMRFKASVLSFLQQSLLLVCLVCAVYQPADPYSNDCACGQKDCRPRVEHAYEVADEVGITKGMLSKWQKDDNELWHELAKDRPGMLKVHTGTLYNVEANDELYEQIVYRRKVLGLSTDGYWIRQAMADILDEKWPTQKHPKSNGWFSKFCKRNNLSFQLKTEKKNKSVTDRLELITHFHNDIYRLQNFFPQTCPIWGAYPPSRIWNADHVPLPF